MMRVAVLLTLLAFLVAPPGIAADVPEGFVRVEPGTFQMGSANGEGREQPVHAVTITRAFIMSQYEVTFDQYDQFCGEIGFPNPSDEEWGRGRLPVINVSWYEALDFCNWLSWKEGLTPCYSLSGSTIICDFSADGYRLPTEAEWEYAAIGGSRSRGYTHAGSDNPKEVAWYAGNSRETASGMMGATHEVGSKAPNELGLFDMSGNVWEWCWDYYGSYSSTAERDPTGSPSGTDRVIRGGSWNNDAASARVSSRFWVVPVILTFDLGFRVVRAAGK